MKKKAHFLPPIHTHRNREREQKNATVSQHAFTYFNAQKAVYHYVGVCLSERGTR